MEPNHTSKPRTAMISGHIDISPVEFVTSYIHDLGLAISRGDHFILGDAQGTDALALDHLLQHGGPGIGQRITVYPSRPYNIARFEAMGLATATDPSAEAPARGGSTRGKERRQADPRARHLQRDARMTRASDYDILWARSEEEARALYGAKYRARVSATELNRQRRIEIAEEVKREGGEGEGASGAKNVSGT